LKKQSKWRSQARKKILSMLILIVLFSVVYRPAASVIGETSSDGISTLLSSSVIDENVSFNDVDFNMGYVNISVLEAKDMIESACQNVKMHIYQSNFIY